MNNRITFMLRINTFDVTSDTMYGSSHAPEPEGARCVNEVGLYTMKLAIVLTASILLGATEALKCYTCDECSNENVLHHFLLDYKEDVAYCLKYNKTVLRDGKEVHLVYRRPVFNESVVGLQLDKKCVSIGPGVEQTPVAIETIACYCQFDGCNAGKAMAKSEGNRLLVSFQIYALTYFIWVVVPRWQIYQ